MAILGSIITGLLNIHESLTSTDDHFAAQETALNNLLTKAKNTAFGQKYKFQEILDSDNPIKAFVSNVPYFDYHQMDKQWWHRVHDGEEDITWPGNPDFLARSSGTTGKKSKKIPVTQDMIDAIRSAGMKQVSALTNFDLPTDIFEKEVMALGSSIDLDEEDGHLVGEISGISASQIPSWIEDWYKPGTDIAAIDDWDKRVDMIVKRAKTWDIGTLSGIPSWMELMMKAVIDHYKVDNIHDIWPNLNLFMSGGVAFGPYEKSFNALLAHPITVVDTYLASEGFIACQQRPETDSMELITDGGIYFEFVPFEAKNINSDGSIHKDAPSLNLREVELGKDYALIISTVSGAWRYLIGDTIQFTDIERAEIKITGRTKFFMNVVGSQLSVLKMETAIKEMQNVFDAEIKEFTVCCKNIDNEFHHVWYLGTETEVDEKELADKLDQLLQDANKNYKVARSKALKGVQVHKIPADLFYDWNDHQKKKGGQVKMEVVMNEDKFKKWESFISTKIN